MGTGSDGGLCTRHRNRPLQGKGGPPPWVPSTPLACTGLLAEKALWTRALDGLSPFAEEESLRVPQALWPQRRACGPVFPRPLGKGGERPLRVNVETPLAKGLGAIVMGIIVRPVERRSRHGHASVRNRTRRPPDIGVTPHGTASLPNQGTRSRQAVGASRWRRRSF